MRRVPVTPKRAEGAEPVARRYGDGEHHREPGQERADEEAVEERLLLGRAPLPAPLPSTSATIRQP